MAEPTLKPFDGQLDPVETSAVKPFTGTLDGETPGLAARVKQGASRAFDSARTALTDDPNKIAQIAAEQARTALPQSDVQRRMAEEFAPYVDEANKAEGVVDNVKAWGAAGLKRAGQLVSNPGETAKMIAEQLPNSLPGMAGGIAGAKLGAMAGTAVMPGVGTAIGGLAGGVLGGFAGGYGLEKGAAMQDQVQKEAQAQRIDMQDESAVARMVALKQPEFDAAAQRKGVGTAGTDALLNVATMGLAGVGGRTLAKEARTLAQAVKAGTISAADAAADVARLQAANAARNTLGAKALRGAGVVGAEMGGEGLSEGVGQKFAYGNVDAGEVIDESLMGLGTGGAMALGSKAFNKAAGIVDQDATTQNIAAASDGLGALGPAFTTAPGAVDPSAARAPVAQAPEAPDLSTTLGAGVPRDGVPFTRDIDTSGLAVEDRGAMERARAAMVDYQPGDATPQWETSMGATAARQGLDMPAPEFDTGTLGFDTRTPSERMGINPAAGPLSRTAVVAVDSGATPVQFLGATGRDLQARATGPGVTNESNVIDVQGRLVEDRAISTPRRLTDQQDGMAARAQGDRLAIQPPAAPSAVPALGGPVGADAARGGTTAVPDGVADRRTGGGSAAGNGAGAAEAGAARAGGRGNSNPALSAPTNLREGLARMRARRQEAADAQTAAQSAPTSAPAVSAARPGAVEAAGAAPVPATTGVNREPSPTQAIQASAQPAQTGPAPAASDAGPGAQGSAAAPAPVGSGEPAAGLTNAATPQNNGAQAAPATGTQGAAQAAQTGVAPRPKNWRTSMLGATPVAKAMGIDTKGKRLAQVVAEIDARDTQAPATPAPAPAPGPTRLGRDNTPLSEGGKPFKTRKAAGDAKKLQPMMRVVTVPGGYALAEKTPAQLAAEERAAKRLRTPRTSPAGEPVPANAFIAASGGLHMRHRNDLGVDGNPRIGNRRLFGGLNRGLSIEQATEMLVADGYLSEGASHNDAYALIKKSLSQPQYNADGIERIAQAESDAQFEDYMAAQEEAAADGDTDPFGMADEFTAEELDEVGYASASPALQAEVNALIAQADAMDIDTYAILEDIARTYANATQDQYNAAAREAIAAAIARGNSDGGSTAAQAAPAAEPAAEQGLNQPAALTQQAQVATENIAQTVSTTVEMPPTRQQESSPFARFATGRYRIAIRDEGNGPYAEVVAIQRGSGVEIEMRMPGEALEHPAFSQLNARAQALFETPTASMFDAEPPALELAAQTPAEAAARQDAQEQATKAEAAAKRAEDAAAKAEEERKRIAQASVRAADSFELGQDPMDSLTGQGGLMFSRAPAGGQTETASFKRWFKGSKVVENGLEELLSKPDGVGVLLRDLLAAQNATGSGLNPVQALMLALAKNDKIGRGIVGLVPVDVVNSFSKDGLRPKDGGGNTSMFVNALNAPVSDQVLSTFRGILTSLSTKLANAIATGRDQEIAPALLASDFNLREVGGLLSLQGSTDFWGGNTGVKSVSAGEAAKSTSPGLGSPAKDFKLDATALADLFNKFVSFAPHAKTSTSDDLPSAKYIAKQGKPLVVYHGTAADFDAFDNSKTGANDLGLWGRGHYFASSPTSANSYALRQGDGARVVPAYVSIQNPLVLRTGSDLVTRLPDGTNTRELIGHNLDGSKIKAIAMDGGHDGVIQIKPDGSIGDVVAFNPEQIKSATGNNGNFDPANADIRFSFAGARAATADKHALVTAQDRLSAGEDAETVRQETGWFQGKDGKWRFEISDAGAQLAQQVYFAERGKWYPSRFLADARDHGSDTGGTGTLGDVLEHPALFAAYPALRDMPVTAKIRKDQESGAFDGRFITATAENEGRLLSVLLHEIQHGIQNIEGFATGGNQDSRADVMQAVSQQRSLWADVYAVRRELDAGKKLDTVLEEWQEFLDAQPSAEALRIAQDPELETSVALQNMETLERQYAQLRNEGRGDTYRRLAGEVEARNTQARQGMTDAQRRATPPNQTADVADSDVIVVFNGKEMESAPEPANAEQRLADAKQRLGAPLDKIRADSNARNVATQMLVDGLKAKWTRAPEIIVARNMQDPQVPQAVRDYDAELKSQGSDGEARGFIYKGKVYLLSDELKGPEQIAEVLFHEVLGHYGLRGAFGESLTPILQQIGTMRRRDVVAKAREYGLFDKDALGGMDKKTASVAQIWAAMSSKDRLSAAEEVLAEMAQTQPNIGFVQRAIAAIRNWLRAHVPGFKNLALTDADIIQKYLLPARGFVTRSKETGAQSLERAMMAFSRTPGDQTQTDAFKRGKNTAVKNKNAPTSDTPDAFAGRPNNGMQERAVRAVSGSPELAQLTEAGSDAHLSTLRAVDVFGDGRRIEYYDDARGAMYSMQKYPRGERWTAWDVLPASEGGSQVIGEFDKHHSFADAVKSIRGARISASARTRLSKYGAIPNTWDGDAKKLAKALIDAGVSIHHFANSTQSRSKYIYLDDGRKIRLADHDLPSAYDAPDYDYRYGVGNIAQLVERVTTSNNGSFDPANADIRFSRTSTATGTQSAWDAPVPTGFDDVIYKLQDKNIDLKRVVEAITKSAGQVADSVNAYLKEELFHKRAAKRVEDFGARELKPLMNQMRLMGLGMEDVEEYLHARHAKEANAVIAQRNPGEPGLQDGGSGMTNQASDNYFAKLDPAQRRKLEAVAKNVDAIIDKTRKLYVSYGLENQDVVDGWASMYQHYIPLMREDKDGGMGTGQGFSVKGKETKGRTGSTRKVVDILANIASQREKLIVRGEKNQVTQALIGLARVNPNSDFWEVRSQAPTERVFDPKKGIVVDRPDPLFKSRDNVVVAKVQDSKGNVTEQMVVFNEDNPRAVRMAAAMKNLDAGNLEGLLGMSAKITRYFSAINTQYNPVFGVVNLVRDVQGAMVNLAATPLAGQQGKIARDTVSALAGIYSDIRKTRKGGQATSQWAQLWEQMQDDGGTTGYRELFTTSADRASNLKSILNPQGWMDSKWGKVFTADGKLRVPMSMAQKGASEIFGWLSDYNEAMENGVRLAAYKAALDMGMSREQAASLSKNLTVNFNRKGQVGMQAGAVYAFFNAAMQGTARIGQTLFDMDGGDISTLRLSKTGKAVVYGGVTLGVMQALALAGAGFDEEDPPEFVRERSLIIPTGWTGIGPEKGYFSIPMPLGLHVIPGIGRHATEFALSGFDKPAKRALSVIGMFADAFNPIGNAGLSMQTLAPTALDPLVALTENKDWTGKPIARVSSNKALPGHTQWKDTATWYSKMAAEAINWVSGGNEYVAGALSPTPDQIDYLVAQVGGGVAREASKVFQAASTTVNGEELPTYKIPLLGRFAGNAASQASQGTAFYANLDKLNALETEIKGLRKDGRFGEAAQLARENPQAAMIPMANRAERDVQKLRRDKRELIAAGATREEVRAKEAQITAVMARLNEAAARRKATSPE